MENSVKHGIGKTHREERIFIRTRALDSGAEVTVEDDGTSYEPSADGAVHVGLDNIRQRLALMCGGTLDAARRP